MLLAMGATHVDVIRVPCSTQQHHVSVTFGVYVVRRTCPTIATTILANALTLVL